MYEENNDNYVPREGLDPSFYADIETFRAAVANGSVDISKGCRSMEEYHFSHC